MYLYPTLLLCGPPPKRTKECAALISPPYQLLTAILVTSPLSSNDSNMIMEDLLPPTLLQDVELRLGVTNAAFFVESLQPNVIDCIQLITRRRSTTLPSQKQPKEAGTIPKHSKQYTVIFPIKEAWLGCALKLLITDDANRPSSSSSKSEYGPWVCHTVVRASFRTTKKNLGVTCFDIDIFLINAFIVLLKCQVFPPKIHNSLTPSLHMIFFFTGWRVRKILLL
jgi:hypothetical protein